MSISGDSYSSYKILSTDYPHCPHDFDPKKNPNHLKWLHIIISNEKAFIMGIFHDLGENTCSPTWMDEFSYRFNRRSFKGELFNRLANCCSASQAVTYPELIK